MGIVHSGFHNFRRWPHNPRYWIVAAVAFFLVKTVADVFSGIAVASGTKLSASLFTFLLYDRYTLFCASLCLIILFCDAPFLNHLQMYYLQRIGRRKWLLGQVLYIAACSLLFFGFAWISLLLLSGRSLDWSAGLRWGDCLEMLAYDNPYWGVLAPNLIRQMSGTEVTLKTFILCFLCGFTLGCFLMYLNFHFRRETGAMIAAAVSVFDFFLYSWFDPDPLLFWISPLSWMNPEQYVGASPWKWWARAGILIILAFVFLLGSFRRLRTMTVETTPEL